jgi:hypothetical protein
MYTVTQKCFLRVVVVVVVVVVVAVVVVEFRLSTA